MTLAWTPISIVVPPDQLSRCGKFGYDLVQHIKANRMDGRKINREWLDTEFQGLSKVCEVVGALSCGVSIEELNWDCTHVDPGWDFLLNGLKVDVKGTWSPQAKYLIYPCDKTNEFDRHDVDVFLMVWIAKNGTKNFGYGETRGWSFKDGYRLNCHTVTKADWKRYRMTAGTWALHQDYLLPMGTLVGGKWRDAAHLRGKVFGGTATLEEACDADRGDGGVEEGLGEQAVPVGMRTASDG